MMQVARRERARITVIDDTAREMGHANRPLAIQSDFVHITVMIISTPDLGTIGS